MVIGGRARTTVIEIDLTDRVPGFPGVYGVMVLDTKKGPFYPYLVTSQAEFLRRYTLFETVQVDDSLALFEALAFLEKNNKLWVVRAENGAKYGGILFSQDKPINSITVTFNNALYTASLKALTQQDKDDAELVWETTVTGELCEFQLDPKDSTSALPDGLIAGEKYYLIPYNKDNFSYRIASSYDNAIKGNYIEFTGDFNGKITLWFGNDLVNSEIFAGMDDPAAYQMNTSDGKPAGINSTFTIDLDNDQLNVSKKFYNSCATGDELILGGSQENLPAVAAGIPLAIGDSVYCIKVPQEGVDLDKYKIQIARTNFNARAGTPINFASQGKTFTVTLASKVLVENVSTENLDINADTITVSDKFYAMVADEDSVKLSATNGTLPTVAGEALDSDSVYYVTKGLNNKIQLSREKNGTAINFTVDLPAQNTVAPVNSSTTAAPSNNDDTYYFILTITDKAKEDSVTIDMSSDVLTVDDTYYSFCETGYSCTVKSDGTLPAGLASGKTYYVIKTDTNDKIMLASTPENAKLGVPIDITDAGTIDTTLGIYHTITDTHNTFLAGFQQNCMMVCSKTPTAEELYVTLQHYPYGDQSEWTEADKVIARTLVDPYSFFLSVYKKYEDGTILQVERWQMSRKKSAKDGSQLTLYCEEVAKRSQYINVIDNPAVSDEIYPVNQPTLMKIAKGYNGDAATTGDMILGVQKMANSRRYNCTLIMDAGYAVPAYQQAIIGVCESRQFTVGILSVPLDLELSDNYVPDICDYRDTQLASNTSYAAIYTPHLHIYDQYNNRNIYVSPTGFVGGNISQAGTNYELWYPVAGNKRGVLNVLGLARIFEDGDEDTLYDDGINPIDFNLTKGIRIWGQKTMLRRNSVLNRLNVRLLLVVIEPAMKEFLDDFLFELNDDITRSLIKTGLESYLQGIQSRRGISSYKVICDSSNNSNDDVDSNILNCHVFICPEKAIEFINLFVVLTREGVSMSMSLVENTGT